MNQGFTLTSSTTLFPLAENYSFSAKERDAETGLSYFGSRYYSSDLSVWLSVDPMSGKYPSLSPYVYCADNPVKLVDPNGEEIWITADGGTTNYQYKNGNLYCSNGRLFDYKDNPFFSKAMESLNEINKTADGSIIINDIENSSDYKLTISLSGKSSFDPVGQVSVSGTSTTTATVNWNPAGEIVMTENGPLSDGVISLAHELIHGYDYIHGGDMSAYPSGPEGDVKICEWKAVYHENHIRKELNKPLRTHYDMYCGQGADSEMLDYLTKQPRLPEGVSPLF